MFIYIHLLRNVDFTLSMSPLCTKSVLIVSSFRILNSLSISTNTASEACRDISLAKASEVLPYKNTTQLNKKYHINFKDHDWKLYILYSNMALLNQEELRDY